MNTNNEFHFLVGFPGSGKSWFVDNYIKNENIRNFHKMDFRIQFNRYYNEKRDILDLKEYLAKQNPNQNFFIELPLKFKDYIYNDKSPFRKSLDLENITFHLDILKNFDPKNIFVHVFYSAYYSYIPNEDWHNLTMHRFPLTQNLDEIESITKPYDCEIESIKRDMGFDWNTMNTRDYCEFKRENGFSDFVLLFEDERKTEEKIYSNGYNDCDWVPCNEENNHTKYSSILEIFNLIGNEHLRNISYFEGKELEEKGMVKVEFYCSDYYERSYKTETYLSIPHVFEFLKRHES